MNQPTVKKRGTARRPAVIISDATLAHLEALVDGTMHRNPALAERLLEEIGRARIVPAHKLPANVVSIGSRVRYRNEATGQDQTVTLVFPEDADITRGRISVMTPIGTALLGLAEGASFQWDTRDHQRKTLSVLRVEPAADDGPER